MRIDMDLSIIIIGISSGILMALVLTTWVEFSTCRGMVKREKIDWDYASFSKFLEEYNKIPWTLTKDFPESRFVVNDQGKMLRRFYFHAGVIIFHNKGMVIRYHEMWKLKRFKKRLKIESYEKFGYPKDRVKDLWKSDNEEKTDLKLVD